MFDSAACVPVIYIVLYCLLLANEMDFTFGYCHHAFKINRFNLGSKFQSAKITRATQSNQ